MTDDEAPSLMCEMVNFVKKNRIYLYLQLRDYAKANRSDWAELIKKDKYENTHLKN